jgi:hypothetical protein
MTAFVRRRELAAFLRSRRARLDPAAHGFATERRRTPGLRREEVAALAGVSLTWYTWLEQARDVHASADVLLSLGRALSLTPAEVEYLLRLGGHTPAPPRRADPRADPLLQALTDGFLPNPASIVTASFDYVAWNRASERLVPGFLGCGDAEAHNLVRFIFAGAAARNPVKGPADGPGALVASLRGNAARHPEDSAIAALSAEMRDTSADFARLWAAHEVAPAWPPHDLRLEHPRTGVLRFHALQLQPGDHPDLTLIVFLPRDEPTRAGVERLGRGAAPPPRAAP